MFTIVKQREAGVPRPNHGQPRPQLIDHRKEGNDSSGRRETIRKEDESYKQLKSQRDDLLVSENIYKRKITELEEERKKLISIYEPTYEENKKLKSILEHGPDAVKVRKLQKAKKETEEEIEVLKVENKRLVDQMKEFMQINSQAKDQLLEHNWQTVLASGKRNKDNSIKKTSRSLPESEEKLRKKSIIVNDTENIHGDTYDLKLDTVEKEIQILLNKVKHLKSEKEQVDFAMVAKKRATTNNPILENAIREKLDKDLATFENNLEMAKEKHENLKKKMAAEKKKNDAGNQDKEIMVTRTQSNMKPISYRTNETQTDPFSDIKRTKSDISLNKSKKLDTQYNETSKQNNKSIQTDSVKPDQQLNSNGNTSVFATRKSQPKDQQSTQKIPVASSRKAMNEYASRLLIKQDVSKTENKNEEHSTIEMHKEEILSPTHTENNKHYDTKHKQTSRSEKNLYEKSVCGDQKNQERSEGTVTQIAASENAKQHFLPMITDKSLSKTNLNKSRVKAKSVGHEDINVMEYIDKIIEQRIDSLRIQFCQNGKMLNPNFRKTRTVSQSVLDVSTYSKPNSDKNDQTKIKSNQVKPQILTEHDRYIWKSESEILDAHYIKKPTQLGDFNFIVPHGRTLIRYKGELHHYDNHVTQEEHRDERAYDKVLADLVNQQRNPNRVNTEFKETAETYLQHKTAIREEQKLQQHKLMKKDVNGLPELMPLKFSSNARNVDSRKIKQFLNRR